MTCNEEYTTLTKATEKLHELYYQQENIDVEFSNARRRSYERLIASGLERLVSAPPAEIIYHLADSSDEELISLHDISVTKLQIDTAVKDAEESYQYAIKRYEDCIKEGSTTTKNS